MEATKDKHFELQFSFCETLETKKKIVMLRLYVRETPG